MALLRFSLITGILVALTGCGGGDAAFSGSGAGTTSTPGYDMESLVGYNTASVEILLLDTSTGSVTSGTGGEQNGNRLETNLASGTIALPQTFGPGTLALDSGVTAYIERTYGRAFFLSDGTRIGIVGATANTPPTSGTATLSGKAQIAVNTGAANVFLTDTTAYVDYGAGSLDLAFDDSRDAGHWLDITGAQITGSRITGGTATASEELAPAGISGTLLAHEGRIFADDQVNVGGVFMIDETSTGGAFRASGMYQAN